MTTTLRAALCAAALTLVSGAGAVDAAEAPCDKNHYILNFPIECEWVLTGNLNAARAGHTATLLPNGMVLVAGGTADLADSVELYDPATGTWHRAAPLGRSRSWHTATLLSDGKVLVVGGDVSEYNRYGRPDAYGGTAEIFDPAAGTWNPTGSLIVPRWAWTATATLLQNGMVLVTGGFGNAGYNVRETELYDPRTGQWTATGDLRFGRYGHTATALGNGKVLLVSGVTDEMYGSTNAAELYDPATGSWTPTGSVLLPRSDHSATPLMDGRVLISGGWANTPRVLGSFEIYDPDTGGWAPAGDLQIKRFGHTATLLSNGAVLTAGGVTATEGVTMTWRTFTYTTLDSVELRPDGVQPSVSTGSLNVARSYHTATRLDDGSVLVAGGRTADMKTLLNSAEVYGGPRSPIR